MAAGSAVVGADGVLPSREVLQAKGAPSRGGLRPTDSRSADGYPHLTSGATSSEITEEARLWSPRLLAGDEDP
jgi:hypothetical protein